MKVIIIEDEQLAAERLIELIKKYDPAIEIIGKFDSVKKSILWFSKNVHPDLVFMDIQLGDGLSFEIFEHTIIDCPVIFTTAFDEYAIRAFKVNSIDYLLKPIDFDELTTAINKFKSSYKSQINQKLDNEVFDKVLQMLGKNYKNRFLIKVGEHIKSINVDDINFFYSLEKATFLKTKSDNNYVIDYSLEQLENLIDPQQFFRINRKYLVNLNAIIDIITYSNSRLNIILKHSEDKDVIVSREKVSKFKKWLDK
ncbi:MAG: LytTR family DNA-binding domain-containing protein [Bacteroidales bacterium]|nr:LytTR family DNA-binding domain-containing protein [Bacteroidales bacterium]